MSAFYWNNNYKSGNTLQNMNLFGLLNGAISALRGGKAILQAPKTFFSILPLSQIQHTWFSARERIQGGSAKVGSDRNNKTISLFCVWAPK